MPRHSSRKSYALARTEGIRSSMAEPRSTECDEQAKGDGYFESLLDTGSVIKWREGKALGVGGFGRVYEAILESGQVIAVKQVAVADIKDRYEIDILRQVKHRNIIKYLGSHRNEDYVYIFTKLIKGQLLIHLLDKRGQLAEDVCCNYTEQLLQALDYLHHKDIVHRDVTPENVMVTLSGHIKLIGFWRASKGDLLVTKAETLWDEHHDSKVDIWGIGGVVYTMATTTPWHGPRSMEPTLLLPARYSTEMAKFISRCVNMNPSEIPTASQLLSDPFITKHTKLMSYERAQEIIDMAMVSGSIQQRNVVGVITGLMGSGKTTLLHYLFGLPPPGIYTSTGVAEQSCRGLLHHLLHVSAGTWQRLSYTDIRQLLALLIRAGIKESDVGFLASCLMQGMDPTIKSKSQISSPNATPKPSPSPSKPLSGVNQSPSCQDMVPFVVKPTAPEPSKDPILELVHMIDTGGQPELMEVMPSLVHNANLALVLVDLQYDLDESPPVDSYQDGVPHRRELPSHYTGRDIVLKLASTLHARRNLNQSFHLLIVATHRDCVQEEDLKARVDTLNNELARLLIPEFEEELILFEAPDKIAFVLNLKDPDTNDLKVLELIRTEVGKPGLGRTFQTPTSFFVFEQDLLHFAANEVKRDILSLDECKEVGARLKMSQEVVEAALVLFHSQNTFLYFRHVLPNHVFIKPQVPLDIINSIVQSSYQSLQGFPAKFVSLLKNATVTEELLSNEKIISSHFRSGIYEVEDAVKLFCHTFIIAPLQSDGREGENKAPVDPKKREYLMMCLKPAIPNDKLHQYIPRSTDTVPLVVKFSSGCVPLGCFGSTISCLLSKYGWKILRGLGNDPQCLAHNIVSLSCRSLLVNMFLVDHIKHIEIHITSDLSIHSDPANVCHQVRSNVLAAIENVFEIMHIGLRVTPAVVCHSCPTNQQQQQQHMADIVPLEDKHVLCCELSEDIFRPNRKELLWMGGDGKAQRASVQPSAVTLQATHGHHLTHPQPATRSHSSPPALENLHPHYNQHAQAHTFHPNQSSPHPSNLYSAGPENQQCQQQVHKPQYHHKHAVPAPHLPQGYQVSQSHFSTSEYMSPHPPPHNPSNLLAGHAKCQPTTSLNQCTPMYNTLPALVQPTPISDEVQSDIKRFNIQTHHSKDPLSLLPRPLYPFTAPQSQSHQPLPQLLPQPYPSRHETPTLPLLQHFSTKRGTTINIPERIGVKNQSFGISLLRDDTGDKTRNIETECGPNPTRITMAILQRWIQGDGMKPISWTTLVTVLKDIQLVTLAEEIEQNLF